MTITFDELAGRSILITGASTGIGAAVAQGFGRFGANIGVHCKRSREAAEQVAAEVRTAGGEATVLQGDVTDKAEPARIVDGQIAAFGRLDVLINNAGDVVRRSALAELDDELIDDIIALNARSVVTACRLAIPHFKRQGHGSIINTGGRPIHCPRRTCRVRADPTVRAKWGVIANCRDAAPKTARAGQIGRRCRACCLRLSSNSRDASPIRRPWEMMKTHGMTLATATATAALVVALACSNSTAAQDRVNWKMQSAFSGSLVHLGTSGVRFAKNIERVSGGNFKIKFYEPGALVPALECFDAASKGSVEACWTTPGYSVGKIPALAFFTTVPFGPQYGEMFAWKIFHGGDELKNELYGKHGLYSIDSFAIGPETSGWFRQPIESLDQLNGLKMRFFGLGAQVMQKLGVSTQLLAGADIYPALERGVIDATEFSMPDIDIDLGFYQIAKNNYYPGWHQQTSVSELLMNKAAWEALPDTYKAMIELGAGESIHYTYAETEAMNPKAMNEMLEKYGVTNRRWTDEELAAFEQAWNEVLQEQSAADPDFKKVADSYLAWRKDYKPWADAQALKNTYLSQ